MRISQHVMEGVVDAPSINRGKIIVPRFLVMHYTGGFSAQSAINAYKNRRVSAHLTIDTDGTIYQHVPFNKAAWHAGPSRHMGYSGLNNHSIGIEIVNPGWFRKSGTNYVRGNVSKSAYKMPRMQMVRYPRVGSGDIWWPEYTDAQLKALDEVTKAIVGKYDLLDIVTHEEIDTRGWKTDPGPLFPMERYKRILHASDTKRDADVDMYEVTASKLNVRQGPGTEFDVQTAVERGTLVSVIDKFGHWARIEIDGNQDGWVHGAYLRNA